MTETPRNPHPPQYGPGSGIKADIIGRDSSYVAPVAVTRTQDQYKETPITRGLKSVVMRPIPSDLDTRTEAQ